MPLSSTLPIFSSVQVSLAMLSTRDSVNVPAGHVQLCLALSVSFLLVLFTLLSINLLSKPVCKKIKNKIVTATCITDFVWECESVGVRECGSAGVWKCGSVGVRECGSV